MAQRTRAIDRLSAWGGTALYDVIIRGVQQLFANPWLPLPVMPRPSRVHGHTSHMLMCR